MKQTLLIILFSTITLILSAQKSADRSAYGSSNDYWGSKKVELSIFPNPATDFVSIKDENSQAKLLVLYNMVGRKVRSFEITEGEHYAISDLPNGMYLAQLVDRNNKNITTLRLNKK